MTSKIDKPYVLRVAELIYSKIIEIKNQNPEVNNIQAFEIFMTTKDYDFISSGKFHENWISELKDNGVDTVKWEVTRYIKVSFAFTNLIVILCGIPLVVLKEKNSLSFGAGSSVFVIFGYYAFIKFGQSLGFKGVIAPLLSAWIGNLVFMAAGILLFWRAKT